MTIVRSVIRSRWSASFWQHPKHGGRGKLVQAGNESPAADYVERFALPPGLPTGLAGFKLFWRTVLSAFPDLRYTVDDAIAEGDKVVLRITARATHQGEFQGIPPTGRQVTWTEIHIGRLANGKLVEHWGNVDQLGLLQQIGAIPSPESSVTT